MKLYHGSDTNIPVVDLSRCKPNKDFGQGFYLTADRAQASLMAQNRSVASQLPPVVNPYEVPDNLLEDKSLRTKVFTEYSEEWAQFVLDNRNGECLETYDIVYGPIANDKVGVQIRLFTQGFISMEQFIRKLKYSKGITFQYYFGTARAVKSLKHIADYEPEC